MIIYFVIWIFKMIFRFLQTLYNFLGKDNFKLFNIVSLGISVSLIGTWIRIISMDKFYLSSTG